MLRGYRIIDPQRLKRCLQLAHEGHLGTVSTKQMLGTKLRWFKIGKDVENSVRRCHECQLVQGHL